MDRVQKLAKLRKMLAQVAPDAPLETVTLDSSRPKSTLKRRS
jgi:hypothetical protein